MTTSPVIWLSKEGVCSRCRMDEWIIEDLLDGAQKRPEPWPVFEHRELKTLEGLGFQQAIVVLPAFGHVDDVDWVNDQIRWVSALTLILTSDEGQHFPVDRLAHPNMRLWVQTPRPEVSYPEGTVFFGVGSGRAWRHVRPMSWEHKLFFSGQRTHARRDECLSYAARVPGDVYINATEAFMAGMERSAYLHFLNQTQWAPAPSGIETQDTFRFYEALECGALPIPDGRRPDGRGGGYWDMVAYGFPVEPIDSWRNLPNIIDRFPHPQQAQIAAHTWWHQRRRDLAHKISANAGVSDNATTFTVVIPTSPIPSHPSTKIIDETVRSIRERTDAEILITCDGVRAEQRSRTSDYTEYVHRLLQKCEGEWWNVTPFVYTQHFHQMRMMQVVMEQIRTPYVLYVEHDTPLVNDIDFDAVLNTMEENRLNMMRFHHESHILEEHEWVMAGPVQPGQWRPTMQWSQRPHLARSDFYRERVLAPMAPTAKVMIEDVMHGIVDYAWQVLGPAAWNDWRIAVWHPRGDTIQRSTHLDGREGDPKYDERFQYRYVGGDEERPSGAPHPQVGA